MANRIAIAVTVIFGFLQLLEFFLKGPAILKTWGADVRAWVSVIATFALGLGAINLIVIHGSRVLAKRKDWIYSAALLVSLVTMVVLGVAFTQKNALYQFLFNNVLVAMDSTLYGSLAFFIASASYRAFRARNLEATVLLVAAILVMLGNVPIGAVISHYFPTWGAWLMNVPNTAGQRGIQICAAIGLIALSLRVVMGVERSHFRGGTE